MGQKVLEPFVSPDISDDKEPVLSMTYNGITAKGKRTSDGFAVLKGSSINLNKVTTCPEKVVYDRKAYEDSYDSTGVLIADLLFTSPSRAAAFVAGASVSGNSYWKDANGKTLSQIDSVQ